MQIQSRSSVLLIRRMAGQVVLRTLKQNMTDNKASYSNLMYPGTLTVNAHAVKC